ncbi:hypothetical protein HOF92_15840 [bacterium]|nr:hypothetical protein [bacterium]
MSQKPSQVQKASAKTTPTKQETTAIPDESQAQSQNKALQLFLQSNKVFETDPSQALGLIEKALEIEPGFEEALKDKEILTPIVEAIRAQTLFDEARQLVGKDTNGALELLKKAAVLDPQHDDIKILINRIENPGTIQPNKDEGSPEALDSEPEETAETASE